jgi:class 3 adenylate cyclase/tetratricopeptide (TPR) repeat protein
LEEGAAAKQLPASERRPVTVLFADLVGFSTMAEDMDPEVLQGLISETFDDLRAEVERREGTVEKYIGDAVMAVFGAPLAHEDDPQRAVDTALAMLEAVRHRSENSPERLELRIGINSGLVVASAVGEGRTGVLGDAVNVAARLQQAASPGDVLVEGSVWRRVRERFEGEPLGSLQVKGRERPVEAVRVLGPRETAVRRRAPFVGRRDELSLLELLWSSAVKGNTHVVSLVGEPGVGKSRLLAELPRRAGALDVRIACGPERAFGPFLDLIERILGGVPSDAADLRKRADPLGIDEETTILLSAFLGLGDAPPVTGMGDEQQKRQVFAGIWGFLVGAAGEGPALLVLDDLHWADLSSIDLVDFLLERLSGVPFLVVLSYRPGFEHVERSTVRASHTGVRLEPLSADETVQLAQGFLGVAEMPPELETLVSTRAEGNAFFIEELLQALLELGSLAVVDSTAILTKSDVDIPDTIQGTILARVDRLGNAERSVLQHAAVIGRSFDVSDLRAIASAEDVESALAELGRAQLVVSQGPDEWAFKHALIQEVVYGTLLHSTRRELHRKVADALKEKAGEDPAVLEVLAEHYARAEASEEARRYAVAAGDLAAERMGSVEAIRRYGTALKLWGEGDEEGRLEVLMKLGGAAVLSGAAAQGRSALLEAEAGWARLGRTRRVGAALALLGRIHWLSGEVDRATEAISRAVEILEPDGTSPELIQAFVWGSTLAMLDTRVEDSMAMAKRGLAMAEELDLDAARSHLLNNIGTNEAFLGEPRGLERLHEALELAERSGDAEAIGRAYVNLPNTMWEFARNREGVELCRRGREITRKLGAPGFEHFIASNEANMLIDLGEYDEGEALAREAFVEMRALHTPPGIVNAGQAVAQVLIYRGRYDEARELLDELLPLGRRIGGGEYLSPLLVVEMELEVVRGNPATARKALEEAVDLALNTEAIAYCFRLLEPLARLLPDRIEEPLRRARASMLHPDREARVKEAEGLLAGDRDLLLEAAGLYSGLELPYPEARCLLDAGEPERARAIIERLGLADGPLGARLRQ